MSSPNGFNFSQLSDAELRRLMNGAAEALNSRGSDDEDNGPPPLPPLPPMPKMEKKVKSKAKPKPNSKPMPESSPGWKPMPKSKSEIMTKPRTAEPKSTPKSTPTRRMAAPAMPELREGMPPVTRSFRNRKAMKTATPLPSPSYERIHYDEVSTSGSESDGSGDDDEEIGELVCEMKDMEIEEEEEATGEFGEASVDKYGIIAWCDEDGTLVKVPALNALETTKLPKKLPSMKLIKHVLKTAKAINDKVREDYGKPSFHSLNGVYARVKNLTVLPKWQEAQLPSLTSLIWFDKLEAEKKHQQRLLTHGLGLKKRRSGTTGIASKRMKNK